MIETTRKDLPVLIFDVIVIGAGPAGMSAGIWCADLGLTVAVVDGANESGGQLLSIFSPIVNYPGVSAENGLELRDRFVESAERLGVVPIFGTEIVAFDVAGKTVTDQKRQRYSANHFVFATGVRRRKLGVPGEDDFAQKGILFSGMRDKRLVRGKTVAIIGGGDAALENAIILADHASRVYVIHRREVFGARPDFVRAAAAKPNVEFILDSSVHGVEGQEFVSSIKLSGKLGERVDVPVDAVLIRIGVEPNNSLLIGKAKLDETGYVLTDRSGQTTIPNVYAIGDVADRLSPTIASAVGMGSTVAKSIKARSMKASEPE